MIIKFWDGRFQTVEENMDGMRYIVSGIKSTTEICKLIIEKTAFKNK